MTLAAAVVDRLVEHGIDTVFGIPGKQTLPLNEAIDGRNDVQFVMARHETAVSQEAWGYAETTGRPAATVVVPGPGDMNAMNGLKNADNDNTPLVHIAVETDPEIRGRDGIHETPPETYDTVTKANRVVKNPDGVLAEVERAVETATTAPKGPVRLGIPKSYLPAPKPEGGVAEIEATEPRQPPVDTVADAAAILNDADAPVIIAGGGVRSAEATDELRAFAERYDAPVLTTYKGKGVIPEDHPLSAGVLCGATTPEIDDYVAEADAALAVGTDFDELVTRGRTLVVPDALVHVTLSPDDLGTNYDPAVGIVADAKPTLAALSADVPESDHDAETIADRLRESVSRRVEELVDGEVPLTSPGALQAVREAVPDEAVVAADAGGFRIWALATFPAMGPRSYVNPGSWATMGSGLPSALGAQAADPDADVVALTGDGGLMMAVHELHTAAAEGLPVTTVVFRNNDYAIISEGAEREHGLPRGSYAWGDTPIDFIALAESMGVDATRAETPEEVRDAVSAAVDADEPRLVEVPTDPTEPQASDYLTRD
ncbi:thiamine pyrophosphate-binding protein [Halolamina salifodinae]|uniref:Acetolactate synthase-1/2/3 large subunit n=1 Tax=Halolamina salifodinae TaxID=1202767 RepID=A0A8T4GYL3_9EURY|nr:thiamine pyrophosphate-binding protein [Halolamina salifodinae]MBP1987342.1 acetolactate synthase-1/2/3 large subunit [Halolamina salifodinae]